MTDMADSWQNLKRTSIVLSASLAVQSATHPDIRSSAFRL